MKKVAYNGAYGSFGLSNKAIQWMIAAGLENLKPYLPFGACDPTAVIGGQAAVSRDNPILIRCIETLGSEAGRDLRVVVVDTDEWHISEYDGWETVRPAIRVNGKKYALIDEDTDE